MKTNKMSFGLEVSRKLVNWFRIFHHQLLLISALSVLFLSDKVKTFIFAGIIESANSLLPGFMDPSIMVILAVPLLGFISKKSGNDESISNLQIEKLPVGCIVWDPDFRAVSWNSTAEKIFGYSKDEILHKNLNEMIVPENARNSAEAFRLNITENYNTTCSVSQNLTKEGKIITCSWSDTPLRDTDGNITGILSIVNNITEQKMSREQQYIRSANRTKSEFLSLMSHELRTPLNAILGFSELLLMKTAGETNDIQEKYLNNIHKSGKHLLEVVSDILDLSKVDAGKVKLNYETIPVRETVNGIIQQMYELSSTKNVTVNNEIDPHLQIEADLQRFKQILTNLLSNAVKFSKDESGIVKITCKKENNMVMISVCDNGIGIKEEEMNNLFTTFHQVDSSSSRKYGGTGLGLVITKKMVNMHNGDIRCESKFGEGSTFTFSMPMKRHDH